MFKITDMKRFNTLLLVFCLPLFVQASHVRSGETVHLTEPTTENTYLAGGEIDVDAAVGGDLTLIGGKINVRDLIEEDGLIIGGELLFQGVAREDLRMLGGEILVREPVAGDLLVVGGAVTLEAGADVGGDLIILGGEVIIKSRIKGNVRIIGGDVKIRGIVEGALEAKAGVLRIGGTLEGPTRLQAREIRMESGADIQGDIRYWHKGDPLDFRPYLADGASARYDEDMASELMDFQWEEVRDKGLFWYRLFQTISGLFLTLVLMLLLRRFAQARTGQGTKTITRSMIIGLLALVGLPIIGVLGFTSVVGAPIGVVSFAFWLILAVVGHALSAVMLTYEWQAWTDRSWSKWTAIGIAGCLFLAMRLLALIPLIGPAVNGMLTIWAVGYFLFLLWRKMPQQPGGGESTDLV
jgi:cytoskeletal protein CcmA (bactofilin family)